MDSSSFRLLSNNSKRKVRKLLARSYLREKRFLEAVEVYLQILKDDPGDSDVYLVLGNLYRITGNHRMAGRMYQQVLDAQPDHPVAKQYYILLSKSEESCDSSDPLADEEITCLSLRLQNESDPHRLEEARKAADMIEVIAPERTEGEEDLTGGGNMQQLLPALIDLNIRQARASGHLETAEALQSLHIHLIRQVGDRWADDLLNDFPRHTPDDTP